MKKTLSIAILLMSAIILLSNCFTSLEINSYKIILLLVFISASSVISVLNQFVLKRSKSFTIISLSIIGLICFGWTFFHLTSDWKTQTRVYQNKYLPNTTIDFQIQDKGAFGYNRRTVERTKIFPFIYWTKKVSEKVVDTLTWEKVNLDINEQGLK